MLTLIVTAEDLEADEAGRTVTVADVRDRYETAVRPGDPRLPPWPELISGDSAREAAQRVTDLGRALIAD